MKKTLEEAGYKFISYLARGEMIVQNLDTGLQEVWYAHKDHAGYGLKFNNTDWEYGYTLNKEN